jgi:hypothetical protein
MINCPLPGAGIGWTISGLTVNFADASGGSGIFSWDWDFGDGNTSTLQNPTHTYAMAGTYTTCLVVNNSCGADTFCLDLTLTLTLSCGPDSYEPNDIQTAAVSGMAGALSFPGKKRICPQNDVDWYQFYCPGNRNIRIVMWDLAADFDIELYNTSGYLTGSYFGGSQSESIFYPHAAAGTYWIHVFGYAGNWHPTQEYQLGGSMLKDPGVWGQLQKPVRDPYFRITEPNRHLFVFPNPATDHIILSGGEGNDSFGLTLRDLNGKTVFSGQGFRAGESIALPSLASGLYLLDIAGGDEPIREKLWIQR